MFRSVASLSRSEISVHVLSKFISQHVAVAVAFRLQQQSASSKKASQREKESKSSICKRVKKQEMARLAASGKEHWLLLHDEAKNEMFGSACCNHPMGEQPWRSSYIIGCTTFKFAGIKDQERFTLHEHCIKIVQTKMDPNQTDGA